MSNESVNGDNVNIMTATQPDGLDVTLYPHQLASIYNMETFERVKAIKKDDYIRETIIGINADQTGYGKTLSMVGLVLRDRIKWDINIPYSFETITSEAGGRIKNRRIILCDKFPTTVILMSPTIISQWKDEFNHTKLRVLVIKSQKDIDTADFTIIDVALVVPNFYNRLMSAYPRHAWKRFIFDEPSHMKVPAMKTIYAGFYWFVTANPYDMITQHRNCKMSFMREILGASWQSFETTFRDMIIKNDIEYVKSSFEMPVTNHIHYDCYQPIYNLVSSFASKAVISMVAAGNIEDAITCLGGEKTSNIVSLIKEKKERQIKGIDAKIKFIETTTEEGDDNSERIDVLKEKKEVVNKQIKELDEKYDEMLMGECPICLTTVENPVLEPKCQNIFCGKCLLKWLEESKVCPMCKGSVNCTDLVYIENTDSKSSVSKVKKVLPKTKLQQAIEIICKKKSGKFIVFSSYDNTYHNLCSTFKEYGISFAQIKGSIITRQKNIKSFKDGNTRVMFLNSNFNGAGINLQEATDIILYHEMNEGITGQILGRANRIGRKEPLTVHHLQVKTS